MTRSNDGATLDYLNLEFNQNGLTVKFKEIHDLSNILFEQLDSRFKQIYDAFQDVSVDQANGQAVSHSNSWASFEELILILRCCMVLLSLPMSDQSLFMEKGQVLLSVLRRLISSSNANGDCCTVPIADGFASPICSSGPFNPTPKHKCALLQVFADELLMHKSLREYFMLIDSASSTSEKLFTCHFGLGDIGSVMEALVNRKSSKTIALKFQKMQTLHLSKRLGNSENNGKSDIYREGEIGKGCNGEIFLKCVLIGSEKSSDLDDLADFIECKQSKDYSVWLKDREKFRMWKTQRLAVVGWEKHKWKPKLKRK
ncbi:hypothetical protein LWI29_006378 [Acer saccharum]|uniref:DUF7812 domain-containing protein n=1 Tax=Acer saccharum TaxID=4024 RepID=A0AA39RKI3_ACESA|nr:hypothetical protein LWI29_006378 [Acer saccharum]